MFKAISKYIWMDGKILLWEKAKIHIMSHSLHYASSVFDGLRIYNGKIFKANEHYNRLHESAKYLDYQIPYTTPKLIEITKELILLNKYKHAYIRVLAWCGTDTITVSHNGADIHTAIGIWERPINYPKKYYTEGINMNISDWKRPDPHTTPVHIKASGLYMVSSISKCKSEKLGFDDALMLDYKNNIAEATSSNIFFVINEQLYTPKIKCCLNGITRSICIDIAKKNNIKIKEINISLNSLSKVQEAFLTGTAIEILPIGKIVNNNKIWIFKPGKITNCIHNEFKKLTQNL